jgi:dUTP pyrophosphatase
LYNHTDVSFRIAKHDRIAQLIVERIATPAVVLVDDLDETARASGGFGSTGQ